MRLPGATKFAGIEGYGADRRIHAANFFELIEQPLEVLITVTAEDAECLFERLKLEEVRVFYVKTLVEFGILGGK